MLLPRIAWCLVAAVGLAAATQENSSTKPVPQSGMAKRHAAKVTAVREHKYDLLMIGDSITHHLETPQYKEVWEKYYAPRNAIDLGYSGARTENILWNLKNGELAGQSPKVITLLIGTNNTDDANYPVAHSPEEVFAGTEAIVKLLRQQCPQSKILLLKIFPRASRYLNKDGSERGNAAKRFEANQRAGELCARLADHEHVFFLNLNHLFYQPDGTLDGKLLGDLLHPTPQGAQVWAEAMEPMLAKLMGDTPKVETSSNNAIVPVARLEKDSYNWDERHAAILNLKDAAKSDVVLVGDSITHFWGGEPQSKGAPARGPRTFAQAFAGKRVLNLGYGWDRTQNVLWRLDHGEIANAHPKLFVLNIGTNNFTGTANARASTPAEVAAGIRQIIQRLRAQEPGAKIALMGVFPRGPHADSPLRKPIAELNALLAKEYANVPNLVFLDLTGKFLQPDGSLAKDLMPDALHPNEKGYAIWADALKPHIP